jgi:hypothetical protein
MYRFFYKETNKKIDYILNEIFFNFAIFSLDCLLSNVRLVLNIKLFDYIKNNVELNDFRENILFEKRNLL